MELKLKITAKELKDKLDIKDGKTPTTEEILALIKPLIPAEQKITDEQIIALIKPLLPAKEAIIKEIESKIKVPQDGNDGESIVGPQGPAGKDGTNADLTGEEIVKRITELPVGKKIKFKDIEDAPEFKMGGTGYLREITDVEFKDLKDGQTIVKRGDKWKNEDLPSGGTIELPVNIVYDVDDNIISIEYPTRTVVPTYDSNGNIIEITDGTTTRTINYNSNNLIISIT